MDSERWRKVKVRSQFGFPQENCLRKDFFYDNYITVVLQHSRLDSRKHSHQACLNEFSKQSPRTVKLLTSATYEIDGECTHS